MQIPNRLKVIGELVCEGSKIADIGADHGLLEQFIAQRLKNYKILAVENKKGPFFSLLEAVKDIPNVSASLSDGMDEVTSEYDTLILAGMGGDNIINILSKYPDKLKTVKHIITDAHSFLPKVRKALIDFGFDIDQEKIVYEASIYYVIISFKRNSVQRKYSEDEIDFGYEISKDPLFKDYKEFLISKYNKILSDIEECGLKNEKYNQILYEMRRFKSYE